MPDSYFCAVCRNKALNINSYITAGVVVHRGECLDRWLENPERYKTSADLLTGEGQ